jgi:hypothetical protein
MRKLPSKTIKDEMLKQAWISGFVMAWNMELCMAGLPCLGCCRDIFGYNFVDK